MEWGRGDKAVERKTVVADASVIVKWFVEEEYSREAKLLRDAYVAGILDIAAPSLMPFEVLNALKFSRAFSYEELKKIAKLLDDYQFILYDLAGRYAERTVEIALTRETTIYDASYVALAYEIGGILYTADEKLLRKVGKAAVHISKFQLH